MEEKATTEQIQTAIDGIMEKYSSEFYPFGLRESGGGWQFLTKKDFHKTVAQLNGEKFSNAYLQQRLKRFPSLPTSNLLQNQKSKLSGSELRLFHSKIIEKELIVITGRNEDMPGKPLIYSTSKTFMDYFGINSADELPKLKEVYADPVVEPTIVNSPVIEQQGSEEPHITLESEASIFSVTENGELIEGSRKNKEDDSSSTQDPDPSA